MSMTEKQNMTSARKACEGGHEHDLQKQEVENYNNTANVKG